MITYDLADPSMYAMLNQLIDEYHQPLKDAGVRVGLLMIRSVDKDGMPDGKTPLKHAGHAAAAKIRVIPLRDRLTKHTDAEIVVDAECWKGLLLPQQRALLDHELEHLVLLTDKGGNVKIDDADRPKLKCKPDDYCINGIRTVAERHGANSLELLNARALANQLGGALGIACQPLPSSEPTTLPA